MAVDDPGPTQPPLPGTGAGPVVHPSAARSRTMRAIRSSGTKPERLLEEAVRSLGAEPVTQAKWLPGTPDLVLSSGRVAVFVDGDYWHGRAWFERGRAPRANRGTWVRKFEGNRRRDHGADEALRALGWLPLRFWASDVLRGAGGLARLALAVARSRSALPPPRQGQELLPGLRLVEEDPPHD